ncbi:putative peroxygenase 3 [Hibiscus syriacus]|uniref:Peroxygenase 3 n=1 Tax=Hibiscus syriacus TaxID=106335 RepID=A0A6A3D5Q1_HIBSY|nr:putative peroxygenase 3 [Hibiscus syriacus]
MVKDDESMATAAPRAPVTGERKIRNDLEICLPKPWIAAASKTAIRDNSGVERNHINNDNLARALVAPDVDNPEGTAGHENNGMSVLQQHVAFFDKNKDGIIHPWDTYFDLLFPIYIERIHKAKHGSDTATYDTEGRFMPVNLENVFSKYGLTEPDKLTFAEVWRVTEACRLPFDFVGWFLAKSEWLVLYFLAKDEQGFLTKEAARKCFDGSLFEDHAKMNKGGVEKNE